MTGESSVPFQDTTGMRLTPIRYWGIFWIDLRSKKTVKQTCTKIAKIGGVEPTTVGAVMNWFSNIRLRYLIILDNANESGYSLSRYLPRSDRGHILITTRDPACNRYGNIGYGFQQV